jgi:hypothetical protein
MKLYISEPSERHLGPILVCDGDDHNDIAEFYHNEHATVGQSYETALGLADVLVSASKLEKALRNLVEECVNPADGGPYEDGEWPMLDAGRRALGIPTFAETQSKNTGMAPSSVCSHDRAGQ